MNYPDTPSMKSFLLQAVGVLVVDNPQFSVSSRIASDPESHLDQKGVSLMTFWGCPYTMTDQCKNTNSQPFGQTQDNSEGHYSPRAPCGLPEAVLWPASQLCFSLCPLLLPSPSFPRYWSQGHVLINFLPPMLSQTQSPRHCSLLHKGKSYSLTLIFMVSRFFPGLELLDQVPNSPPIIFYLLLEVWLV